MAVSAHSGDGLRRLLDKIEQCLSERHGVPSSGAPVLTRARHVAAVRTAGAELGAFLAAWDEQRLPATVAATHVRAAADALGELIGTVHVDDVLDAVFRRFCVGK